MPNVIDEYRSLLTAAETIAALDAAIDLLLRIANGAKPSYAAKTPRAANVEPWIVIPSISIELAVFVSGKRLVSGGASRGVVSSLARSARATWLLDNVPDLLEQQGKVPEAQYSLLMDLLLLVFHQAYFVLLPKMQGQGWSDARSEFLSASHRFAEHLPRDADRYQVLGLVFEANGNLTEASNCYRTALNATHVDDHDFITRAQMLWSHLHEMGDPSGRISR